MVAMNATRCPKGHVLTFRNTAVYTLKRGQLRRVCLDCRGKEGKP